jgi:uncharacterized protein
LWNPRCVHRDASYIGFNIVTLVSLLVARANKLSPRKSAQIHVERDIPVPMHDGAMLLCDRWFATDLDQGPVVLMRSPYGQLGPFGVIARLFAERGFQFVLQRCRGTCGSGGSFDPMRQERTDGLDTIDWIRTQPWFVGRLYTFGASYLGYTQWAIAKEAEDRIDAMSLQVTLSNFRNETLAFGGFTQAGSLQWTTLMKSLEVPVPLWRRILRPVPKAADFAKIHAHLPLGELDKLAVGEKVSWWQDWVSHDDPGDPWWVQIDHSADVADVKVPTAMVGGWRDIFLPWQVKDFETMQANGRNAWLTIGPWGHATIGGFGESVRQALDLFSAHSKGTRPLADRDRVRLYIMGADEWREYPCWPPPGSREERFFLHACSKLSLVAPSEASDATNFVYDPSDPTPAVHGPKIMGGASRPDMSLLEKRSDTISFTSIALSSDMEAIGAVSVDLSVSSDRLHTDFFACLCDVDRAGRALHVVDGYLRLRPGMPPQDADGIRQIKIQCWPTAYRFKRGHRLRLIVASGAHPRYARNLGTGDPLRLGTHMVKAHQRIFHDPEHASALCLTLCAPVPGVDPLLRDVCSVSITPES